MNFLLLLRWEQLPRWFFGSVSPRVKDVGARHVSSTGPPSVHVHDCMLDRRDPPWRCTYHTNSIDGRDPAVAGSLPWSGHHADAVCGAPTSSLGKPEGATFLHALLSRECRRTGQ